LSGLALRVSTTLARVRLFLIRLLPIYKVEKPGKDYYSYILCCQTIMMVFICFYTKMIGDNSNLSR
jgi:hypothetical protein